jgi:hypothetical protein
LMSVSASRFRQGDMGASEKFEADSEDAGEHGSDELRRRCKRHRPHKKVKKSAQLDAEASPEEDGSLNSEDSEDEYGSASESGSAEASNKKRSFPTRKKVLATSSKRKEKKKPAASHKEPPSKKVKCLCKGCGKTNEDRFCNTPVCTKLPGCRAARGI